MDVAAVFERVAEPAETARLRELVTYARGTFTPWQAREMALWDGNAPFERSLIKGIRQHAGDGARIREQVHLFARHRTRYEAPGGEDRFDGIPAVLAAAASQPAVASALVWHWFRDRDADLASHFIHLVRERAALPGLRRRLVADEQALREAGANLPALAVRFADRQLEDACAWIEGVPAPHGPRDGATLAIQEAAIAEHRRAAPRISDDELAGFAQRAATFLVQLSAHGRDPVGFPLAREVSLDTDPAIERRIAIASWARRSGHRISPRGRMFVLAIPIGAPWPLRLELVAADVGHGQCGGTGLLLRLDGGGTIAVISHAPILLCLPEEPAADRGRRFERWLAVAYPQATEAWRAWS